MTYSRKWAIMRISAITTLLAVSLASCRVQAATDFVNDVAPIFAEHCVRCHSDGNAKGDVSLSAIASLRENGYVVAGKPDDSYLIDLVTPRDGEAEMPKEAEPLSTEELAILRRWISEGAVWPDGYVVRERSKADATWWAYQPLDTSEHCQTIDEFIRVRLSEQGLVLNPPADRRTLIRRATYDLIGLPPTPEEVEAFVKDPDPRAYEKWIDRLLQSPQYGERWGRHWLDVVRFGESNGFERNFAINDLWPFRDYVIRSFNEDKPMDRFIREHLAGDVFCNGDPDTEIGAAFLVAGPYDDVKNQDVVQQAQIRANTIDEIIGATGEAFLGMTLSCARCHDHKFDPITQQDYYALYATFAGVRHGSVPWATPQEHRERATELEPLIERQSELENAIAELDKTVLKRAQQKLAKYEVSWSREAVDRTGTEDRFSPVTAKFVRLVCEAQDNKANSATGFGIDEFEVWSVGDMGTAKNVALAENGGKATGKARLIEDFPDAYGPHHAIDGKTGARFIASGTDLTIELAEPTLIDRVLFSSAKNEATPELPKFAFVAEYRIEVSTDAQTWKEVASSKDRKPNPRPNILNHRLLLLETNDNDRTVKQHLTRELAAVNREIAKIPVLPTAWIGSRVESDAQGPFHIFLGGSPQKKGDAVVPASLSVLSEGTGSSYRLTDEASEAQRRLALADWMVHPDNPLTPRVLANRLWHYHFGVGIVDTPSDFGYMGGRPSHPQLLDYLAIRLKENGWRIKPMHRMIMLSDAYRQSSASRDEPAQIDGDSRLLWRFRPRRLSAEEIRDTMLAVAGQLNLTPGGPGYRLYRFMQDNVCTYVPLDVHGPGTYRRAIYHQNARASVVDLMTEYDQPDCTFSAPKRAETTTPLQALTMFNHRFTLDMAEALSQRLTRETNADPAATVTRAFQLCYGREPTQEEANECQAFIDKHSLTSLCRVLLNTSELIYVQ